MPRDKHRIQWIPRDDQHPTELVVLGLVHTIPKACFRLDGLAVGCVLFSGAFSHAQLHKNWPAEFDHAGMVRTYCLPLGGYKGPKLKSQAGQASLNPPLNLPAVLTSDPEGHGRGRLRRDFDLPKRRHTEKAMPRAWYQKTIIDMPDHNHELIGVGLARISHRPQLLRAILHPRHHRSISLLLAPVDSSQHASPSTRSKRSNSNSKLKRIPWQLQIRTRQPRDMPKTLVLRQKLRSHNTMMARTPPMTAP
ncbi:MAG: hypothetical protein L6R40_004642 [Gallowayella cf. fulva]|nr:MAG: hypothetical protein L6R40_004642 [Xanthomendoza cf. fulva]